jgi:deazaflavin-dependent oxidoreductase (nitroreductase family)
VPTNDDLLTGDGAPRTAQRAQRLPGQRALNVLVRGLLRTPGLAQIVGRRLVTLYVVGRKSGRRYYIPVAYMSEGNDLLIGTSSQWGRNLASGEPVAIRLKGRRRWATARVSSTEADVAAAYSAMARANATFAKFNHIHRHADGEPDRDDLHLAWAGGARAIRLTPRPVATGVLPAGARL